MLKSILPSYLPNLLFLFLSLDLFIISFLRAFRMGGFVLPQILECLIGA